MAHKTILVPLVIALSALSLLRVSELRFSGDIGNYLSQSDRELEQYIDYARRFGSFEPFVIIIEAGDVRAPEVMREIERLSSALAEDHDVEQIISLARTPVTITADPDNPFFRDLLLRNGGRQTSILILADALALDARERLELAQRVRALAGTIDIDDALVKTTGPALIALDAMQLSQQEFQKMFWLAPLVLGVALLFIFRGHLAVFAVVMIIGITLLWTLALYEWTGNRLTLMSAMMPVVISVVAFADAVHILHRYFIEITAGHARDAAIRRSMGFMNVTCMMTSLTTAIGFLALCAVTSIQAVRQFTLWTAVGVMIAFLLIVVLMPIVLGVLPTPGDRAVRRYEASPLQKIVATLYPLSQKRMPLLPFFMLILIAALAWGSMRIEVRTNVARFLPQDIASVRAYTEMQGTAARIETLDLVFEIEDGSFMDAVNARALAEIETGLRQRFDEIRDLRSFTRAVEGLHAHAGNAGFPTDDLDLEEYLLAIELAADDSWLHSFLSEDFRATRVSMEIDSQNSSSTLETFRSVEAWLAERIPAGWSVASTGPMKLLVLNIRALVNSQLLSFLVALAAVSLVIHLYLRDVTLTLASTLVNLLPVLVTMGLLPLLAAATLIDHDAATLNASTVMVPGLAMALVVDDTIHFLACYRERRGQGAGTGEAIESAFRTAGFAMTATTLLMILGFATLYMSVIPANREFATMLIIALAAALAADLLLLPNLIRQWVEKKHA